MVVDSDKGSNGHAFHHHHGADSKLVEKHQRGNTFLFSDILRTEESARPVNRLMESPSASDRVPRRAVPNPTRGIEADWPRPDRGAVHESPVRRAEGRTDAQNPQANVFDRDVRFIQPEISLSVAGSVCAGEWLSQV